MNDEAVSAKVADKLLGRVFVPFESPVTLIKLGEMATTFSIRYSYADGQGRKKVFTVERPGVAIGVAVDPVTREPVRLVYEDE